MPQAPADRFTRIALILTGLMMCLPFVQTRHTEPFAFFYSEWLAFALGLAAMTLMLAQRARDDLRLPRIALLPLGLLAVLALHVVLGKVEYVEQAIMASLYLIWATALMLLGALLQRRLGHEALVRMFAWCMVAGGIFSAIAGILQTYDIRGLFAPIVLSRIGDRAFGNIAQANHFGNYVTLAAASLIYLTVRFRAPPALAYLFLAIMVYALALSASISVWLYLISLASLAGFVYARHRTSEHRRLLILCVLVAAGFGLAQLLIRLPGLEPSGAFASATERAFHQPTSIWIRFKLWYEAWLMFLQSPVLGVGYGQFVWQHFLMVGSQPGDPVQGLIHNAHNLIMQVMAEMGSVGLGILLGLIGMWLWGRRETRIDTTQWWLLAMLGVITIHSLLEYPLWLAYFLGIVAVLLGAGETRFIVIREANYLRTGAFAVVSVGAFCAVTLIHRYHTFEQALYSPPDASPAQIQQNDRALLGLRGTLFTPYIDIAIVISMPLNSDNLPAKLGFVSRVARFVPQGPVMYKYSALLALSGDMRQAIEILDRAFLAYPELFGYLTPQLDNLRGMDRLKIAPYLERVQKYSDQQKKSAAATEKRP